MGAALDNLLNKLELSREGERLELAAKTFSTADRKSMAKAGTAMADGSFPIATKEDLQHAISTFGLAKDPAAAKAWIIKRAKALDMLTMLPESWDVPDGDDDADDEDK